MKPIRLYFVLSVILFCSTALSAQRPKGLEAIGSYKGEMLYGVYQLNPKTNTNDWVAFLTPTGNDIYKYIYYKKDKLMQPYAKLYSASVIQDLDFDKVRGYVEVTENIEFMKSVTNQKIFSKITLNGTELFDAIAKANIVQPEDMTYVAEELGDFLSEKVYGVYHKNTRNIKNWMFFLLPTKHDTETYVCHDNDAPFEPFAKVYDASILNDFDLNKVVGYVKVNTNFEYTRAPASQTTFALITINGIDLFYYFEKHSILTAVEKERLEREKSTSVAKKTYKSPFTEQVNKAWAGYNASKTKTCPVCGGSGKEYLAERNTNTTTTYSEDNANYYKKTKTSTNNYYRKVKCYICKGTGKVKQ